MPTRPLTPILGTRQYVVVCLAPDLIRFDIYDQDRNERGVVELTSAEVDRLIIDLQRARWHATRET